MNVYKLIESLQNFVPVFTSFSDSIDSEDACWTPDSETWSIVAITCHLADEEVEDFRLRLQMTLTNPKDAWPPFDPHQAAIDHHYQDQDFREAGQRFVAARRESLEWLKGLDPSVDWSTAYDHPQFGPFTAGMLLASWSAHDWLHLRQMTKRRYEIVNRDADPFSTRYAGDW